jgi:hypothetical protein
MERAHVTAFPAAEIAMHQNNAYRLRAATHSVAPVYFVPSSALTHERFAQMEDSSATLHSSENLLYHMQILSPYGIPEYEYAVPFDRTEYVVSKFPEDYYAIPYLDAPTYTTIGTIIDGLVSMPSQAEAEA